MPPEEDLENRVLPGRCKSTEYPKARDLGVGLVIDDNKG